MKYLYLVSVIIFAAHTMAMPPKDSLSSDEYYGDIRRIPDATAIVHNDDHQKHNLKALSAYVNGLNMDSQMLRKQLLRKLSKSPAHNNVLNSLLPNFDEIDKTSDYYGTLDQLDDKIPTPKPPKKQ